MSSSTSGSSSSEKEPKSIRKHATHKGKAEVIENILAGLAAGVVGTVIGYPLDLLKTRMQVASKDYKPGKSASMWKMSASILRNEGIQGFFKGLVTPLVSISLLSSATFVAYTWLQHQVGAQKGWDVKNGLAAMITAPIMCPITTLEGLVRTQMQVDNINKKQYHGSWNCITTITREHGLHTLLTHGMTVTVLRDAAYLGTYFYVYEGLKATLTGNGFQNDYFTIRPEVAVPLSGGTAGAMAWVAGLPFDCVRAGVQGQDLNPQHRKSGRQIFQELMESRGLRALYRGVGPTMARAFVVSGSRFSAYELSLWLLRREEP